MLLVSRSMVFLGFSAPGILWLAGPCQHYVYVVTFGVLSSDVEI